ncbi:hypothetical protein KBC75_02155 [Candidatus Shapirobacteria bacterium]|nr:hypothetical protein [Candidatus Shapirobacteria bacterium]
MVQTVKLREQINKAKLSLEIGQKIEELLKPFGLDEEVPDNIFDQILKLVDLDIKATELERDIYQSGADMADEFLKKIDDEAGKIADELEEKAK